MGILQDMTVLICATSYTDLLEVFNKMNATKLPPHRHCDCSLDITEGSTFPQACVPTNTRGGESYAGIY